MEEGRRERRREERKERWNKGVEEKHVHKDYIYYRTRFNYPNGQK